MCHLKSIGTVTVNRKPNQALEAHFLPHTNADNQTLQLLYFNGTLLTDYRYSIFHIS